jgi:hypothetical protein
MSDSDLIVFTYCRNVPADHLLVINGLSLDNERISWHEINVLLPEGTEMVVKCVANVVFVSMREESKA